MYENISICGAATEMLFNLRLVRIWEYRNMSSATVLRWKMTSLIDHKTWVASSCPLVDASKLDRRKYGFSVRSAMFNSTSFIVIMFGSLQLRKTPAWRIIVSNDNGRPSARENQNTNMKSEVFIVAMIESVSEVSVFVSTLSHAHLMRECFNVTLTIVYTSSYCNLLLILRKIETMICIP